MTDAERERWQSYARDVADRMGLKDWVVEVPAERYHANSRGGSGTATLCYGRRLVRVYLPDLFHRDPPEEQRDTIVHELVHCHFAPMDGMAEDWLDAERYKGFHRMFEHGVDAMAAVIAPHMPLPLTLLRGDDMGQQKTKPAPVKIEAAQPKPKAGPKPAPKAPKGKGAK